MSDKPTFFYTRKGDTGTTMIYGQSERLPKDHVRITAYGTIDEAQAFLGVARASSVQPRTQEIIIQIEHDLYVMMSELAVADSVKLSMPAIDESNIDWLESVCHEIGEFIGKLAGFVLPGDTLTGAYLHVARTVTRRAERLVTRLYLDEVLKNKYNLVYLNRLSSLLFVLALYEDRHGGVESPTYAGAKQL